MRLPALTDVLDLEHRHRVLHAAHHVHVLVRGQVAHVALRYQWSGKQPHQLLAALRRRPQQSSQPAQHNRHRTIPSLQGCRQPPQAAPTCTNTSPGPRPSSSLAGTRESEQPILRLERWVQQMCEHREWAVNCRVIWAAPSCRHARAARLCCRIPASTAHHSHWGV